MSETIRINKYLADQGLCSRREADTFIEKGKVFVNGKKATLGQQVNETDKVEVNGLKDSPKLYLAYYKGRGVITHSPAEHETDIMTKLLTDYPNQGDLKRVAPVGRLDKDSEGLIILTNDGRVTAPLLDPETKHEKEYHVTVDKTFNNFFIRHMSQGVDIEGYKTKPAEVTPTNSSAKKSFVIVLTEGKKHQIRRMCAALGYQVQSLKRLRVMNIELGKLKPNQYRALKGIELMEFLKELGIK